MGIIQRIKSSWRETQASEANIDYRVGRIYGLPQCGLTNFVEISCMNFLKKILFDCYLRSTGFPERYFQSLNDSCVYSDAEKGLVSLMAYAWLHNAELFLVKNDDNIVRVAFQDEQMKIRADYKKMASSPVGAWLTFTQRREVEILRCLFFLKYLTYVLTSAKVQSSSAVRIHIGELRALVSRDEAETAIAQAKEVAAALNAGEGVLLDAIDRIDLQTLDMAPVEVALDLVYKEIANVMMLSKSYVQGELTSGLNANGAGDIALEERGLQNYFYSVFKPACDVVYGFRPNLLQWRTVNLDQIETALRIGSQLNLQAYMTDDEKRQIMVDLLKLDPSVEFVPKDIYSQSLGEEIQDDSLVRIAESDL